MGTTLGAEHLGPLSRGYELYGSGGGGSPRLLELALAHRDPWPLTVVDSDEIDPATPCMSVGFVGSTILLSERLLDVDPFGHLVRAIERWLGQPVPVVCSLEGGGVNGLAPLLLGSTHTIVDADCTGRAVPGIDQLSVLIDAMPGIVAATDTGGGGVALVSTSRPVDIERVVRAAIVQAGGTSAMILAGFTVGDLNEHAMTGHLKRALDLGKAYFSGRDMPFADLAHALGGELLGVGRITRRIAENSAVPASTVEIVDANGREHRIVTRSETLAFLSDGRLRAAAPDVIVTLDVGSRNILGVTDLRVAQEVAVIALPAPLWWQQGQRATRVAPSAYGLSGLDTTA